MTRRDGEVVTRDVCPCTILPNLIRFGLEVRDPAFAKLAVRWRRGNAAVCKTAMRGFDSRSHLTLAKQSAGQNFYAGVRFPFAPQRIIEKLG